VALAAAFTYTHGLAAVVFPFGVRLSTWIALAAFLALAVARRDGRPLAAGAAWFFGFEAAYQASALATGHGLPALGAVAPFMIGLGAVVVGFASARGVHPAWRLMLVVAAIWTIWLAIGFPANGPTLVGFDPLAEALNEAAKSVWALAYLLPLLIATGHDAADGPTLDKRRRSLRVLFEHDA
jgi:hypothetical protein